MAIVAENVTRAVVVRGYFPWPVSDVNRLLCPSSSYLTNALGNDGWSAIILPGSGGLDSVEWGSLTGSAVNPMLFGVDLVGSIGSMARLGQLFTKSTLLGAAQSLVRLG